MSSPRERLELLARRAGYSRSALERLAEATLPRYVVGEQLDDSGLAAVSCAVEILAQGGMADEDIPILVTHYERQWGHQWRERFWRAQLRIANWRHNHPELYGSSPCGDSTPAAVTATADPAALELLTIHPAVAAAPILCRPAA